MVICQRRWKLNKHSRPGCQGKNLIKMDKEQLNKLSDYSYHESLGIFTQWRVGDKAGQGRNVMFPYYSPEQCREILDNVCGITGWTSEYREVAGYLFCSVGIYADETLVEKSDAGGARTSRKQMGEEDTATFHAKTAASSSFVRACLAWGIGRHIKILPQIILPVQSYKPIHPETGQPLSPDELNAYCNKSSTSTGYLYAAYKMASEDSRNNERVLQLFKELKEALI